MPFRLARALRAHFAAAVRNRAARKECGTRAAASARCAAEPLEDRRLLTVSIVTPYQYDVEGYTAAFFADFTADARPEDAMVSWGDGTVEQLQDQMMDFGSSTGRLYGIHRYDSAGDRTVTFTIKQGASEDSETFVASIGDGGAYASPADPTEFAPADSFGAGAAMSESTVDESISSTPITANQAAFRTMVGMDPDAGYPVPSGANQTRSIPWTGGINAVSLRFDYDMAASLQQGDLVVRGVNTPTYTITGFSYNPTTRTGTWTLQQTITNDKIRLILDDALVAGLDGEWTDNADAYPSGNGTAGGDFVFKVHVLGGDATQDGQVNAIDLSFIKQRLNLSATNPGASGATYSPFADITASGSINALDVSSAKQRLNRRLPASEPPTGTAAIAGAGYGVHVTQVFVGGPGPWGDLPGTPPSLDVDIDSDNNNGWDLPARTSQEDDAETSAPGKVVIVNDDDTDGDGIPDYADGFDLHSDTPDDDSTSGDHFVPIVVSLDGPIDLSDPATTITFSYNASSPESVERAGNGTADSPYTYTPGAGRMRIWMKDGADARDKASIEEGGDFVPNDVALPLSDLGFGSDSLRVTLWAEVLTPSESIGDAGIRASLSLGAVLPDSVALTGFKTSFWRVNPDETVTQVDKIEMSHPTPRFSDVSISIVPGSLHTSADKTRILGDVHFTGSLDDAASDLIAGADGQINSVSVYHNGTEAPLATLNTSVSKSPGGDSLIRPYDFSATFSQTIAGVELQPGWNLFHLSGENVYGLGGYAEGSVEVVVQAPPDEQTDVRLRFDADPYTFSGASAFASFRTNGGAWSGEIQLQRQGAFEEHKFVFGTVVVDFDSMSAFDRQAADRRTASVTNSSYKLNGDLIVFTETGPDTGIMEGGRLLEEHDRTDYTDYIVTAGAATPVTTSGGGDITPFLIEFDGPRLLLEDVTIASTTYKPTDFLGSAYLADTVTNRPRPFLAVPVAPLPAPGQPAERRDGAWNAVKGFGAGLADTGISMRDGVKELGKGAWHVMKDYNPISIIWRLKQGGGFLTVEDKRRIDAAWQTAQALWNVASNVMQDAVGFFDAALTGDIDEINRLGDEYRVAFEFAAETLEAVRQALGQMEDFDYYRIVGRVVGESLVAVVTAGAGSALKGATMPGVIAKLTKEVQYIANRPALVAKLEGLLGFFTRVSQTSMCFVAGTLVNTAEGLRPIEGIRAGDLVLSRDQYTGEQTYKPVLNTVVTHPDALYTVTYDPDGAGPLQADELVTTAPHPFWVVNADAFVAAEDLKLGDEFRLADGTTAEVVDIEVALAASGDPFTTYNFEVADFHTYFVGEDGVWVHNNGRGLCERMFSFYTRIVEKEGLQDRPWDAFKKLLQRTDSRKFKLDGALGPATDKVMRDAYDVALRKGDITLVPTVKQVAEELGIDNGYSRVTKIQYQNHHTVPKYVQDLLFQLDNVDRDSVPSLLLSQLDHTGANPGPGRGSFHTILYKHIAKNARRGDYSRQELIDGLRQAYYEFGRPDVWGVAEKWLAGHGVS